jgi:hypothetical protein
MQYVCTAPFPAPTYTSRASTASLQHHCAEGGEPPSVIIRFQIDQLVFSQASELGRTLRWYLIFTESILWINLVAIRMV